MKACLIILLAALFAILLFSCNDNNTNVTDNTLEDIVESKHYSHIQVALDNVGIEYNFKHDSYGAPYGEKHSDYNAYSFDKIEIINNPTPDEIFYNDTSKVLKFYYAYSNYNPMTSSSEIRKAVIKFNFDKMTIDTLEVNEGRSSGYRQSLGGDQRDESAGSYIYLKELPFNFNQDSSITFYLKGTDVEKHILKSYSTSHSNFSNFMMGTSSNSSKSSTGNYRITDSSTIYVKIW